MKKIVSLYLDIEVIQTLKSKQINISEVVNSFLLNYTKNDIGKQIDVQLNNLNKQINEIEARKGILLNEKTKQEAKEKKAKEEIKKKWVKI